MIVDLSADLGEGTRNEDELWPLLHSANVACGGHAGDEASMTRAVQLAREHNVQLGAHPSFPDREHFGRRSLSIDRDTLRAALIEQMIALRVIASREGLALQHVKAHGALYNDAHRDPALAAVIVEAMTEVGPWLALVAPENSQMAAVARDAHVAVIREAFGDRRYAPDGSLVPRSQPGSLLAVDEAVEQAKMLANDGAVIASDGTRLPMVFDTICIHSDMEGALERLRAIRAALTLP